MASITPKVYVLESDFAGIVYIGTSKQKLWNFLVSKPSLYPKTFYSYWSFSQILRLNNPCNVTLETGVYRVRLLWINKDLTTNHNLFTE